MSATLAIYVRLTTPVSWLMFFRRGNDGQVAGLKVRAHHEVNVVLYET